MNFQLINTVKWTSSAGGKSKTKVGVIVAVIAPNQLPRIQHDNLIFHNPGKYKLRLDLSATPRDHESYLVAVQSTKTGKLQLYHPRVNQLHLVPKKEIANVIATLGPNASKNKIAEPFSWDQVDKKPNFNLKEIQSSLSGPKYFLDTEFIEGPQKERFPISLFRKHTKPTIDLISIGIVAEDGRELYLISKDFNIDEAWNRFQKTKYANKYVEGKSEGEDLFYNEYWLRDNILKPIWIDLFLRYEADFAFLKGAAYDAYEQQLKSGEYDQYFTQKSLKALIQRYGKTNKEIAAEIKEFVAPSNDRFDGHGGWYTHEQYFEKHKPEFYAYYADYDWVAFCWLFGKMIDLPNGFPMYCRDLKQDFDFFNHNFKMRKQIGAVGHLHKSINDLKDFRDYPKQENEHVAIADARWTKKLYDFIQIAK